MAEANKKVITFKTEEEARQYAVDMAICCDCRAEDFQVETVAEKATA